MGVIYGIAGLALFAVMGAQIYDALRGPATGTPLVPLLTLGAATLFFIPAWGLWFGARWGWAAAVLCFTLVFAVVMAVTGFMGMVCLMLLAMLYDTAPRPLRPGSTLAADTERLASVLGMKWADTPLSQIGDLLQSGKFDAAAKLYRDAAEVSWDVAWSAVGDWENNDAEHKLRLLVRHLESHPSTTTRVETVSPN
jgi:hypothetical protein